MIQSNETRVMQVVNICPYPSRFYTLMRHLKISHGCLYIMPELISKERGCKPLPVYREGPPSPLPPTLASTGREILGFG